MTQMLDTLPNVWAISEPEFLTQLSFLDRDFSEPVEDVIRAGFALQCKPGIGREEVELNVVKAQGLTVAYSPLLASACLGIYMTPICHVISRFNAFTG